jgi:hypothetical protein
MDRGAETEIQASLMMSVRGKLREPYMAQESASFSKWRLDHRVDR